LVENLTVAIAPTGILATRGTALSTARSLVRKCAVSAAE
jgi:hypothetical protein